MAKQRKTYGEMLNCTPSRFLDELPQDDLNWEERNSQQESTEDKAKRKQDRRSKLRAMLNN